MRIVATTVLVTAFSFFALSARVQAHEFNWRTLTLAWIKLQPNYDFKVNVDGYMQTFRAQEYERVRRNEFALNDLRKESLPLFMKQVTDFSLDEEFTLLPRLEIGKYDFAEKGFAVLNMSPTHYWYESGPYAQNFSTYRMVFFSNPELLNFIKMEPNKAKEFVARQGNGYNRNIYGKVQFRVLRLKTGRDSGALIGEIQSATLYEDANRQRVITEIVKSKEKVVRRERIESLVVSNKIAAVVSKLSILDPAKDGKRWKTYEVDLAAGKSYQIDAVSEEFDSYLVLQGPDGQELATDDDSGGDRNARIIHRITTDGRYRIMVTSYGSGQTTGEFSLTIRERAK